MALPPTNQEKQFLPPNNFDNPGAELNLSGWATGSGSGAAPTTEQTAGASDIVLSRETSSLLVPRGSACLKIAKPASNEQGEFLIRNFTINNSQVNRPNTLEFLYSASSNFVFGDSGDIKVFIADLTTSIVVAPFPNTLDGSGKFAGQWQASSNRDYQLILWIPTTTTLAWDFYADSFTSYLSDSIFLQADSDWVSYTPATAQQGFGNISAVTAKYRKLGPDMEVEIQFTTGTHSGSDARFAFPTGLVSASDYPSGENQVVGTYTYNGATYGFTVLMQPSVSYFTFGSGVSGNGYTVRTGSNITGSTSNGKFSFRARVRIQGWTSGYATPGVSAQNVPVVMRAYKNGGAVSANTIIPSWTAVEKDSVGAFNATTGVYTVKVPGDYSVTASFQRTAASVETLQIYVNGSSYGGTQTSASQVVFGSSTIIPNLKVGDTIDIRLSGAGTTASTNNTFFSLFRIADPSAFLTIPKVATIKDVKAANTAGGTATSGSFATRTLNTLSDPFGIVSLASNQFTLQPGTYRIYATAPAFFVGSHKAKLRNITAGSDTIIGSSEFSTSSLASGTQTSSFINGVFSITVATTFEIQHRVETTRAANGFGVISNFGVDEVYTQVEIQKLL